MLVLGATAPLWGDPPAAPLDSSSVHIPRDSSGRFSGAKDTASKSFSRADSAHIVKRSFNHRQQIIAGSVVMACIAGVLVVMNNYNPR